MPSLHWSQAPQCRIHCTYTSIIRYPAVPTNAPVHSILDAPLLGSLQSMPHLVEPLSGLHDHSRHRDFTDGLACTQGQSHPMPHALQTHTIVLIYKYKHAT